MARWQANIILLVAALIWGGTFVVQKISGNFIGPMWFNGIRFSVGAVCLLPLAYMETRRITAKTGRSPLKHLPLFAGTGIVLAAAAIVQHMGILETSVANAGFLTTTYVPLTPILAVTLFRRKPHWVVWPGAVGCLIGTYLLSGGDLTALGYGDILVLVSAFLWASHILLVSQCMDASGAPLTMATTQFVSASMAGLIAASIMEPSASIDWIGAAPYILFAGILAVAIGFTAQVIAQNHTPPSDAAIMLSMEAVFAAVVGGLILGETLARHEYIGCSIILISVLAVEVIPSLGRRPQKAEQPF